ncbi:MAG: excalibur calcium-binding domain-containing protein [Candidatus Nanopelagicales bacterium]
MKSTTQRCAAVAGASLLIAAAAIAPATASSSTIAPTAGATKYKNCTALNKVYPHGLAKSKTVKDKTSGVPVKNFWVNAKVYAVNTGLDRDKDGIACEKR